ncbi:MAG: hypothetical protein ACI8S6_005805 [Myxococcota bacterium]|jgi:hypothetical protein
MIIWLLTAVALAGEADVHYAQARLHLRRGWLAAAAEELRAATETEGGRARYDICWLAADVAWQLLDVAWATELSELAAAAAPDEASRTAALERAEGYRQHFGVLVVHAPHGGMTSRLQLESVGIVINPDHKRYINRAALAWRDKTPLPARRQLPAGSYLVNGLPVTVTAGSEEALSLPMRAVGPRALTALQVTRIEASAGVRALSGPAARDLLPGAAGQASLTQPMGPLILGLDARMSTSTYIDTHGERVTDLPSADLSARVGVEGALSGALSIRPSLRIGAGRLSSIPLACADICTLAGEADIADEHVSAGVWLGGGALTIEYRQAGRTTAMGSGVTFTAERAWGTLPETLPDGQGTDTGRFSAGGLMMLANLSLAL